MLMMVISTMRTIFNRYDCDESGGPHFPTSRLVDDDMKDFEKQSHCLKRMLSLQF